MSDFSYDVLPYSSYPFEQTLPENLASVARLFGLQAPDFRTAKVLELGCSSGGNLLPLAELYPEAHFTGVDLSEKELEEGRAQIEATGLTNATLLHMSVNDIGKDLGEFDYIVAHGLYSWVPVDTQRHILRVCKENLSRDGVAYISYNTYPGWNLVNSVRDMMRYHTRAHSDPVTKTGQARAVLKFMIEGLEGNNSAHAQLLRDEMKLLADKENYYLFHDHLANINRPVYFFEFIEQAREQGLDYLADTDVQTMLVDNLPAKVAEKLKTTKDLIQVEQYMDFFRNRRFRHTLLCHQGTPLNRAITPAVLRDFHIYSDIQPKAPLDEESMKEGVSVDFAAMAGRLKVGTSSRLSKLAFKTLSERNGRPIALRDLVAQLRKEEPSLDDESGMNHLLKGMNMLNLVFSGVVKLRLSEGPYLAEVPDKPRVTKAVRYLAAKGSIVTNGRNQPLKLQPAELLMISQLDGEHTLEQICDFLVEQEKEGKIAIQNLPEGTDAEAKRAVIRKSCEGILQRFANVALLV